MYDDDGIHLKEDFMSTGRLICSQRWKYDGIERSIDIRDRNGVWKMRRRRKRRQIFVGGAQVAAFCRTAPFGCFSGNGHFFTVKGNGSGENRTKVGIKYLKSLETKDAAAIENEIKAIKEKRKERSSGERRADGLGTI